MCIYICGNGKKCKNKSKQDFCHKHVNKQIPDVHRYIQEKPDECPVCMENLRKTKKPLPCGHWVHYKCILRSGKKECPICRQDVDIPGEVHQNIEVPTLMFLAIDRTHLTDTHISYICNFINMVVEMATAGI